MGRRPTKERYFARNSGNELRYYRTQTGLDLILCCINKNSKWQLSGWTIGAATIQVNSGVWWEITELECPCRSNAIDHDTQQIIDRSTAVGTQS